MCIRDRLKIQFKDSSDNIESQIMCASDSGDLRFYSGGSNERFRLDSSGRLLIGTATARANFNAGDGSNIQLEGTTQNTSTISAVRNSNNDGPAHLVLAKTRNGSVGGNTVVQSGDNIGSLNFEANDGTNLIRAAEVLSQVDGTPGTNDMPGRLIFKTTADGAASATERMRITSAGDVGIGTAAVQDSSGLTSKLAVGIVTAATLYGDGSNLTGIAAGGGSGQFNTGITGATAYAVTTSMATALTANASSSYRTVIHLSLIHISEPTRPY